MILAHASLAGFPDHDSLMIVAAMLPVLLVVIVLIATALQRRGLLGDAARMIALPTALAAIAVGLSLAAAVIHFAVLEAHLVDGLLFGLFFLAVGAFQLIWAQAYLLNRGRAVAAAGVLANTAIVATWLLSRTIGVPLGPQAWVPEPVGLVDLTATSLELALIALLLPSLMPARMRDFNARRLPVQDAAVLAGFCVVTITVLTAVALLGVGA